MLITEKQISDSVMNKITPKRIPLLDVGSYEQNKALNYYLKFVYTSFERGCEDLKLYDVEEKEGNIKVWFDNYMYITIPLVKLFHNAAPEVLVSGTADKWVEADALLEFESWSKYSQLSIIRHYVKNNPELFKVIDFTSKDDDEVKFQHLIPATCTI